MVSFDLGQVISIISVTAAIVFGIMTQYRAVKNEHKEQSADVLKTVHTINSINEDIMELKKATKEISDIFTDFRVKTATYEHTLKSLEARINSIEALVNSRLNK